MKKYRNLELMKMFQQRLDSKFGRNVLKAGFILLLMGLFSSCGSTQRTASSPTSIPTGQTPTSQPATPNAITITDSGQTETPNAENTPQEVVRRIRRAYFAKKTVTNTGTTVNFTRIDSGTGNTQNDAQGNVLPYDSILGKTVYLVVETENLRGMNVNISIRPGDVNLTGNTNSLELMFFNYDYFTNGNLNQYLPDTQFTAQVGDLRALNNRDGSNTHYTNLNEHQDRAIIKLQLRPNTRATFNTWSALLAANTANLEIVTSRPNFARCAYGDSTDEVEEAGFFLNTETNRFRIIKRDFYEIYHEDNEYNFLSLRGTERNKIAKLVHNNSTQVNYYYYDRYDNEHFFGTYNIRVPNAGIQLVSQTEFIAYNNEGVNINFLQTYNDRYYANLDCWAGLLGAMALNNTADLGFGGFSYRNGTGGGSTSHNNGVACDLRYLRTDFTGGRCTLQDPDFDYDRQVIFNEALYSYGWGRTRNMLSENFNNPSINNNNLTLLPHTSHYRRMVNGTEVRHHHHLHMQGFDVNMVYNLFP